MSQLFPDHEKPEILFQAVRSHQEQPLVPEATTKGQVQPMWKALDRQTSNL